MKRAVMAGDQHIRWLDSQYAHEPRRTQARRRPVLHRRVSLRQPASRPAEEWIKTLDGTTRRHPQDRRGRRPQLQGRPTVATSVWAGPCRCRSRASARACSPWRRRRLLPSSRSDDNGVANIQTVLVLHRPETSSDRRPRVLPRRPASRRQTWRVPKTLAKYIGLAAASRRISRAERYVHNPSCRFL